MNETGAGTVAGTGAVQGEDVERRTRHGVRDAEPKRQSLHERGLAHAEIAVERVGGLGRKGAGDLNLALSPMSTRPQHAIENDVHIVGISSLAAGHLTLVPELKDALSRKGRADIMIVVGGVIPPQDFQAVRDAGASAIFPPGTVIAEAAEELIDELNARLGYAQKVPA